MEIGLYVPMFVLSMYYFTRKGRSRMTRANKLIILAALLLFLIATVVSQTLDIFYSKIC